MSAWHEAPDAAVTFSRYCAPTVLAGLFGCDPVEAAEVILAAGLAHSTPGAVDSYAWHRWLRTEFGGYTVEPERPGAQDRLDAAWERWERERDRYYEGERWNPPAEPAYAVHTRYTVAQFLREHPEGTIVISIGRHTLLARDGVVVADSVSTKSARGRVKRATFLPGA